MAFYIIDKKKGITSNKQLLEFKNEYGFKKSGFSGVLDPFATGLLIIATDGDTKFLELFLKANKRYTGTILFGHSTNTFDSDGEIIEILTDHFILNKKTIEKTIIDNFLGEILQTPPKFSNVKVNGIRAHKLSRNNIDFDLKKVKRNIMSFTINNITNKTIDFDITVSSGTYIRSLANDLGKKLNIPATLFSLRRESIGKVKVPQGIQKIKREDIIEFNFIEIKENDMKDLLDGKEINFISTEKNIIMFYNKYIIWVYLKYKNTYKIKKRIK